VDGTGLVLADSSKKALKQRLEFQGRDALFTETQGAITADMGGKTMRIAHAASPGYETYRTGWHSLLIREL
jgi:hypothetical protein